MARLVEPEAAARRHRRSCASAAAPAGTGVSTPCRRRLGRRHLAAAAASVEGNLISIDEFLRVDLRVAKVLEADLVAGADKLLKLRLDVGELGERQIFAGIRAAYDPATLVGPADRRRRKSASRARCASACREGMMLAAGPGGKDIFVLSPDSGAAPGMRVK